MVFRFHSSAVLPLTTRAVFLRTTCTLLCGWSGQCHWLPPLSQHSLQVNNWETFCLSCYGHIYCWPKYWKNVLSRDLKPENILLDCQVKHLFGHAFLTVISNAFQYAILSGFCFSHKSGPCSVNRFWPV